jgi:hypothetical protein
MYLIPVGLHRQLGAQMEDPSDQVFETLMIIFIMAQNYNTYLRVVLKLISS